MKRRKFLLTAGYSPTAACFVPQLSGKNGNMQASVLSSVSQPKEVSVAVKDNIVFVETPTLSATIEKIEVIQVRSKHFPYDM
jgi:hypothetical protein